jgi:hypothetical protein
MLIGAKPCRRGSAPGAVQRQRSTQGRAAKIAFLRAINQIETIHPAKLA